jgi:FG-GAP-like repeat
MRLAAALLAAALAGAPAFACAVDPYSQSAYPQSLTVDSGGAMLGRAWYDGPSEAYDHFVLGRQHEPTVLHLQFVPVGVVSDCGSSVSAGEGHVFEDIAPRLADLNGDGGNEVIVVRSGVQSGAQLTVYGVKGDSFGLMAATKPLGRHRWLAPAGIADFDGNGSPEIAYVDRPHLVADLVYVRLEGDILHEVARVHGVTNHRIGDDFMSGGVRDCGAGPEVVVASADWSRLLIIGLPVGRGKIFENSWQIPAKEFSPGLTLGAYASGLSPFVRRSAFLRTRTERRSCIAKSRASVTSSS